MNINQTLGNLGDGRVVETKSGETIFKLDSCPKNPIVKPQELGLTWYEGDKLRVEDALDNSFAIK